MRYLTVVTASMLLAFPAHHALADRTELPQRYWNHGLINDAKREYILILSDDKAHDTEKARSLSSLADIAFNEGKVSLALATWRELIETYPNSPEATTVNDRINQIGQITEKSADELLSNVVARTYILHGDWWSNGKNEGVTIDTSWIPKDDAAIAWYDRVIAEFPGTPDAIVALKKKFYTVYGWKDPGQYGSRYGVKGQTRVEDLIAVFSEIELAKPDDIDLQRFRYMIAQSYWERKYFDQTREWLQKTIDADAGQDGFYKDLAEWRLKKVEY